MMINKQRDGLATGNDIVRIRK